MWIFRIIMFLLIVLTFFYYITVCIDAVMPIFKRSLNRSLIYIPFYAWIKGL